MWHRNKKPSAVRYSVRVRQLEVAGEGLCRRAQVRAQRSVSELSASKNVPTMAMPYLSGVSTTAFWNKKRRQEFPPWW